MDAWLESVLAGLKTFGAAADLQVVLASVAFTYLLQATIWKRFGFWYESLLWVPVVLSMLLTPVFSTTAETTWGGQYYWKQTLYSGISAAFLWRVGMPYVRKKWPAFFEEEKPPDAVQ